MANNEVISMINDDLLLLEEWWKQCTVNPLPLSDYNNFELGIPLTEDENIVESAKKTRLAQIDHITCGSSFAPLTLESPLLNDLKRQFHFLHWKCDNCPSISYPFAPSVNSIIPQSDALFNPDVIFHVNFQQLMYKILLILRNIIFSQKNDKKVIKLFFTKPTIPFLLNLTNTSRFEYTSDPDQCDIEIVLSPSIITGNLNLRQSALAAYRYVIYDCRLYWPLYTKESYVFQDIIFKNCIFLYSIDYLLGIKSHPLSWALTDDRYLIDTYNDNFRDEEWTIDINTISVIRSMINYLITNVETSENNLYPILTLDNYFDYCSTILYKRWHQLSFYKQILVTSNNEGAYAWIYNDDRKAFSLFAFDEDTEDVERFPLPNDDKKQELEDIVNILLKTYNIKISPGVIYGTTNSYGRISMMCSTTKFTKFIEHLQLY